MYEGSWITNVNTKEHRQSVELVESGRTDGDLGIVGFALILGIFAFAVMFALTGCGGGGSGGDSGTKPQTPPTTTADTTPPPAPKAITFDQMMDLRWIAPIETVFLTVELEEMTMFADDGVTPTETRNGFHLRFCQTAECDSAYLFFAVGDFDIEAPNKLCFKNSKFWSLPPAEYQFQPMTRVPDIDYEEYTTADFCALGVFTSTGELEATVTGARGTKTMVFTSENL